MNSMNNFIEVFKAQGIIRTVLAEQREGLLKDKLIKINTEITEVLNLIKPISKIIAELGDDFILVQNASEVRSLNNAYKEDYNYYFINPYTFETYGSYSINIHNKAFSVGEYEL